MKIILFFVFFYITTKQMYSKEHFTGGSKKANTILRVSAISNLLILVYFFIRIALNNSILIAVLYLVLGCVITIIVNGLISFIIIRKYPKPEQKYEYYYACDVKSTLISDIGIIVNPLLALILIFFRGGI